MSTYTSTAVVPRPGGSLVQTSSSSPVSSTPQRMPQSMLNPQGAAPSPGKFRHPRLTEIAKRRSAGSFNSRNVQVAMLNAAVLLATFITGDGLHTLLDVAVRTISLPSAVAYVSWILLAIRTFFLANVCLALQPVLPFAKKPDNLDDIPLTPSQRALFGLPRSHSDPSTLHQPAAPALYVTPPRYRRASPSPSPFAGTPQSAGSDRRSISANYSASPLSTSRHTLGFSPTPHQSSATPTRRFSASLFSPSSPLFNKALVNSSSINEIASNPDFTESTRSLLAGNTSTNSLHNSLRRSYSMREPGTPSPGARERSKINVQSGLNYKWLYEKGLKVGKNGSIEY